MEVRLSPYNSPFVPHSNEEGVYWLGKEHQHGFHTEHVNEFIRSGNHSAARHLSELTVENTRKSMSDEEYARLYDLYFNYGIQAAGRRLGFA